VNLRIVDGSTSDEIRGGNGDEALARARPSRDGRVRTHGRVCSRDREGAGTDQILDRLAVQQHTSKAALIRRFVRERVQSAPPIERDPVFGMLGADDFDPQPVDDVVYQ
jgi:hypothetical protein